MSNRENSIQPALGEDRGDEGRLHTILLGVLNLLVYISLFHLYAHIPQVFRGLLTLSTLKEPAAMGCQM